MPKHNKKRNSALLYEMLVREAVKQSINKNKEQRDKIISTLKSGFGNNTEIGKELGLFKNLLETKGLSPRMAEKLIQETKKEYKKLDTEKIFNEQSKLIKKMNKEISKEIFSNFIPNYRNIAVLSQIFGEDISIKRRVILEEGVLEFISSRAPANKKTKTSNAGLVVNKFIEKFNARYNDTLLEGQKVLLNKFILSFLDSGADFKIYLNEEIGRLKEVVNSSLELQEIKEDSNMSGLTKKVLELIEDFKSLPINENTIKQVLRIQNLAQEIQS